MTDQELKARLTDIGIALCWNPAGVGIGQAFAARLKNTVAFVGDDSPVQTMAICDKGLLVNRGYMNKLTDGECLFVVAHETLHVAAGHLFASADLGITQIERTENGATTMTVRPGMERNHKLHNIATDAWINDLLRSCGLGRPPAGVIFPETLSTFTKGKPYTGKVASEDIYHWLVANAPDEDEQGGGQGDQPGKVPVNPGAGCGPEGLPPNVGKVEQEQMRAGIREAALIGKGTQALADAMKPPPARVDWRSILRNAFETANADAEDRSERSFARPSRREIPDIIMPGLVGTEARMAVVIDVSSSVGPAWAARAVGYIEKLGEAFPGVRVFLATHTDSLCWSGWVTPGIDTKAIVDSTKFGGGTDAGPAYDAVRETKAPFDVLVHFTDCDLPGWPQCPAKRQVVGVMCKAEVPALPAGARGMLVKP